MPYVSASVLWETLKAWSNYNFKNKVSTVFEQAQISPRGGTVTQCLYFTSLHNHNQIEKANNKYYGINDLLKYNVRCKLSL